jgi:tetratricopeptide (TPR) repeat protein
MPERKFCFPKLESPQYGMIGTIVAALIAGIFLLIVTLINREDSSSKPETPQPPIEVTYLQHPEVERKNAEIYGYFKQINNISDSGEKQRLLDIVFLILVESIEIDPNDGETHFLYAEAHLLDRNYDSAFTKYDSALENNYSFVSDVHFGYGYAYEARGEQYISKNYFSDAEVHYENSISYLKRVINEQKLSYRNVNEAKEILSRVEQKKEICKYGEIYRMAFSHDIYIINNYDVYLGMEELAISFTNRNLWKNAALCYYWLFMQNITGQRRINNTESFRYISERWEYSEDFMHNIATDSVNAFINSNNVNFRKEHIIADDNIIREFILNEQLKVLQRSDFKQSIGNVNAYWYKVCTDDGIEGWTYGQYLNFYPIFPFQ